MNKCGYRPRRRRVRRRGAAVVEFALCVPVLFMCLAFLWEFSRAEMIRQTVATAAYEGARQAIVEGGSAADAQQMAQSVIDAVGTQNATITITPSTVTSATTQVQVTVSAPLNGNALVTPFFFKDFEISSEMTLRR